MRIDKSTDDQLIIEAGGVITRLDFYSNSVAITQPNPHQTNTVYLQHAEIAAVAEWLAAVAKRMNDEGEGIG